MGFNLHCTCGPARSVLGRYYADYGVTLMGRGGDHLVIQTEVHYDGYVYNIFEPTDSLRLTDFAATLYNYSF